MYAGEILEKGNAKNIGSNPMHPYTRGLIECIPRMNENKKRLHSITGSVTQITDPIKGCCFKDRCSDKTEVCKNIKPKMIKFNNHFVKCHLYGDTYER